MDNSYNMARRHSDAATWMLPRSSRCELLELLHGQDDRFAPFETLRSAPLPQVLKWVGLLPIQPTSRSDEMFNIPNVTDILEEGPHGNNIGRRKGEWNDEEKEQLRLGEVLQGIIYSYLPLCLTNAFLDNPIL